MDPPLRRLTVMASMASTMTRLEVVAPAETKESIRGTPEDRRVDRVLVKSAALMRTIDFLIRKKVIFLRSKKRRPAGVL